MRERTLELLDTFARGDNDSTVVNSLKERRTLVDDLTIVAETVGDAVEELVTMANLNSHADTEASPEVVFFGGGWVLIEVFIPLTIHEVNLGNESKLDSIETVVEHDSEGIAFISDLETIEANTIITKNLLVKADGFLHNVGIPLPEAGGTLDVSDDDGHLTLRRLSLGGELWVGRTTIKDDVTGKLDVERNTDQGGRIGLHARENYSHDACRPSDDHEDTKDLPEELFTTLLEILSKEQAFDATIVGK
jgi:hypothetical protein